MNRQERKRKFNEAIVNMLYPPPPQPDPPSPRDIPLTVPAEGFACDISDGLDDSGNSSRSGDESETDQQRLSRAQRKRVRKKKLKEEATRRGKLIGPLLPLTPTIQQGDTVAEGSPAVRSNASEENSAAEEPSLGPPSTCANSNKVKHRRSAKRMAKEKLKSTNYNNNQLGNSTSPIDPKEAH
ncbi:hypothetical protein L6164_027933 [Bauhinia variegata]|uniref:Uncharacterized protein n=1 Tax=Bauhinia variegata TaxID=167791 RepID=A0ACB9LVK6_BAUVA|nr:hypothetical protein L6164_027933 [Bauhinia variegata]